MQFLLKIFNKDETASSISDEPQNCNDILGDAGSSEPSTPRVRQSDRKKKPLPVTEVDETILKALAETAQPIEDCADLAFFKSLLPSVRQQIRFPRRSHEFT